MMSAKIPIVDFSSIGLKNKIVKESDWEAVSKEVYNAFAEIGFVYLRGHGIPQEMIEKAFNASKEFFNLPLETKLKYERGADYNGYSPIGIQTLNAAKIQREIRETYTSIYPGHKIPTEITNFEELIKDLCSNTEILITRILKTIAYGLQLKDVDFFTKTHAYDCSGKSRSALRLLHYPAVHPSLEDEDDVTRCREHSDYGSITVLFQEPQNGQGLQVMNEQGEYVNASPIPETVLVNIGEIMQRWTSDRLLATKHRIEILPGILNEKRYSIAVFCTPADNVLVECLDGGNKYPSMLSQDCLSSRTDATYAHKHN